MSKDTEGQSAKAGGGEGGAAAPKGSEGAPGASGGGGLEGLAPEVQQHIEGLVTTQLAGLTAKFEKDLGAVKSQRDKARQEAQQLRRQAQQAEMQATIHEVQRDPGRLKERIPQLVEYGMAERQAAEERRRAWEQGILEEYGLDEEAAAELQERLADVAPQDRAWAFVGEAGKLATERARAEAKAAEAEARKALEGVGDLVKAEVAKALRASGLRVMDTGESGGAGGDENPIKDIRNPDKLLSMGFNEVREGKA